MPDIQPFRGLRYDLKHVGDLTNVVCPPYDVIDPALHEKLYKLHPANFVRVELNREEPGDIGSEKYDRAKKFLANWRSQGVLATESQPAVYVYHQIFESEGQTHTRRGFMARCRLSRFGQGQVFPHEETLSGPKADRLLLMQACRANLSQIFGLFPDASNTVQNLLEQHIAGTAPIEAKDHLGVIHRMWPVSEPCTLRASHASDERQANLHRRRSSSVRNGVQFPRPDRCRKRWHVARSSPANFVLMMCVGMDDPGLLVLPTHRLFRGLPAMTAAQLAEKLKPYFTTTVAGTGSKLAAEVWAEIETANEQGTLGLFSPRRTILGRWRQSPRLVARRSPKSHPNIRPIGTPWA